MSHASGSLRNIAFVGHPLAGKTSLIDALAFALGAAERRGSVADKTSICDTDPEEHERQHTLSLAAVHAKKDGIAWNLIDTPGYPEFVADALSAMFAVELVVGVVSCASGVTFNLRQRMQQARALGRARAVILTHVDGENVDFDEIMEALEQGVGGGCVPVLVPDQCGPKFDKVLPMPAERKKDLFDRVMDACDDENVVSEYLETETVSGATLDTWVPIAIAKGSLVPVLVCNPVSGLGIAEVLAWLAEFAPTPVTHPLFTAGEQPIACDPAGKLVGVVFNVKSDPHVGRVCLARIVSGTLSAAALIGSDKGEKLGGLFHAIGGKRRDAADSIGAGDIAAFSKVEQLGWGASFSLAGQVPPSIDVPTLPTPMVSLAVVPKTRGDEQKIGTALHKLAAEDPCLKIEPVAVTHELVVHGMSDLHLQIVEQKLKRRYGVEITAHLPRIAYRETITKPVESHYRHKKQSGGRGQFGECYLRLRPGAENSGVVFVDGVVGGSIPRNLIPAVEKGVREVAEEGVLTHSKVVDVEIEVYDGKYHAVDSDEASFKKAGAMGFREGFQKASPVLLEPIMNLVIQVPTSHSGHIFSDITSHRRGHVLDQTTESDGALTVIRAAVPLATLQVYHRDLKAQTAGEGSHSMEFSHYARVPGVEQAKILAEIGKKHAAEEE